MSIRKRWILTFGIIAILVVIVNSFVLGVLISRYFNRYLDQNYEQTCNQLSDYLKNALASDVVTAEQMNVELEAYLDDSITKIKVYDIKGNLLAQAYDSSASNYSGMGMMHEHMMSGTDETTTGYEVVDSITIQNENGTLGTVHITRESVSGNSEAAKMFQKSLRINSLFTIGILLPIIILFAVLMSRRVSKDLKDTAIMAQNIEDGKENSIQHSKTQEIQIIQRSLTSLETRLKMKQQARKTLVDEMVHQTRTPLTILKMHIEGIEDGVVEMDKEHIRICENQVDNLEDIITNISSLIDAKSDRPQVSLEELDLHPFIKQIGNGMKAQFHKKKIEFILPSTDHIMIHTDKYLLGQSIYNLLTNAYKFTPAHGTVQLSYRKEKEAVIIEVNDTGCGIKKEDQKKIFDAYYKKNSENGKAGDGLGLFVVKENVERVGGNVNVISEENQGSTFYIILPA